MPTQDALSEAARYLPAWVGWVSPVVLPAVACVLGLVLSLLALAVTRQRIPPEGPWYEVARLIYPRRVAFGILTMVGSMAAGGFAYWLTSPVSRVAPIVITFLAAPAFSVFPLLISDRVLKGYLPRPTITRQERYRNFVTALLLGWLPLLPPLLGFLFLPTKPGPATWIGMALLALASLVVCSGFQIRLAERLGVVRGASERVQAAVERASARTGHRPRATYECDLLMANAFAFVWTGDLLFTRPIVEVLSDAELESVAMHELSHVAEPLKVRLSRSGVAAVVWVLSVLRSVYATGGEIAALALIAVALAGFILMQRVAKRMETEADQLAGTPIEDTPVYAHALEKIYRYNVVPAVMPKRGQVHPHLYDRMTAAGALPDYPRPDPPHLRRVYATSFVLAFVFAAFPVGSSMVVDHLARERGPSAAARAPWLVALGGTHQTFEGAAEVAWEEERMEAAAALFRVAHQQDPTCFNASYSLVRVSLDLDHCDQAESALQDFIALTAKYGNPDEDEDVKELKKLVAACRSGR